MSLIKKQFPDFFTVRFTAETTNLIEKTQQKLQNKRLNDVSNNQVFNQNTTLTNIINQTDILSNHQQISKSDAAQIIFQQITNIVN